MKRFSTPWLAVALLLAGCAPKPAAPVAQAIKPLMIAYQNVVGISYQWDGTTNHGQYYCSNGFSHTFTGPANTNSFGYWYCSNACSSGDCAYFGDANCAQDNWRVQAFTINGGTHQIIGSAAYSEFYPSQGITFSPTFTVVSSTNAVVAINPNTWTPGWCPAPSIKASP